MDSSHPHIYPNRKNFNTPQAQRSSRTVRSQKRRSIRDFEQEDAKYMEQNKDFYNKITQRKNFQSANYKINKTGLNKINEIPSEDSDLG
jgi:hypothetical protein